MIDKCENDLFEITATTDIGMVRRENEDYYGIFEPTEEGLKEKRGVLIAIADGMGGLLSGAEASRVMIETLSEIYLENSKGHPVDRLRHAFVESNNRVFNEVGKGIKSRAGTTCTVAALFPGHVIIAHAGDSRAYILRDGGMSQITEDHNVAGEMLRKGMISRDEAADHPQRNMITRAVGLWKDVEPDFYNDVSIKQGDSIILCSDGLTSMLSDRKIEEVLISMEPAKACERLIELAKKAGGRDNITVILARRKHFQQNGG